jgi:hypothetical protein
LIDRIVSGRFSYANNEDSVMDSAVVDSAVMDSALTAIARVAALFSGAETLHAYKLYQLVQYSVTELSCRRFDRIRHCFPVLFAVQA